MQNRDECINFRFDGLDSADHKLDLYALGESLQGLARIAAVAGHFAITQKYSRYFSVHEVRILASEPKANCFTVTAVWEFVKQHQILSGSFGAIGGVLIAYVLATNAKKEREMKHLKDSLDLAIRELGNRDQKVVEQLIGVIGKMASELRPAAIQAVAPLGKSADYLTVTTGNGEVVGTFDLSDAEEIRKLGENELTETRSVVVRLSELDTVRGSCKVHLDGSPDTDRVPALIADPLLQKKNNIYALALASGEKISVRAKLQLKGGEVAKLYISDVEV
jgi:hypothetical protein